MASTWPSCNDEGKEGEKDKSIKDDLEILSNKITYSQPVTLAA